MRNFKPLAILCGCTVWFVWGLVGNPEDRFSHNEAQIWVCGVPCFDKYSSCWLFLAEFSNTRAKEGRKFHKKTADSYATIRNDKELLQGFTAWPPYSPN